MRQSTATLVRRFGLACGFLLLLVWGCALCVDTTQAQEQAEPKGTPAKAAEAPAGKQEAPPVQKAQPDPKADPKEGASIPKAESKGEPAAPAEPVPPAQPADQGPTNAAQKKLLEDAKKAEEEAKNKAKMKIKVAPRQQHIDKPGAPRPRLPKFLTATEVKYKKATAEISKQFDRMRRGEVQPDRRVIEAVAEEQIFRMTDRGQEQNISKRNEDVIRAINTAKEGNDEFVRLYKRSLFKFLQDPRILLNNGAVVGVNALILATDLFNGRADVNEGVGVFLDVLKDQNQIEGVHYLACRGFLKAKAHNATSVQTEREAVGYMLAIAARPETQDILLETIAKVFGEFGYAFAGNNAAAAEVGTFLGNLAMNRKKPIRMRAEAAIALGKMKFNQVPQWNFPLQALIIGKTTVDLVRAFQDGELEKSQYQHYGIRLIVSIKFAKTGGDPSFDELTAVINEVLGAIIEGKEDAPLPRLEEWIASQEPPKSLKLGPQAVAVEFRENAEQRASEVADPPK